MQNAVLVRKKTNVKQANGAITGTEILKIMRYRNCKSKEEINTKFTEKRKFNIYMFAFSANIGNVISLNL